MLSTLQEISDFFALQLSGGIQNDNEFKEITQKALEAKELFKNNTLSVNLSEITFDSKKITDITDKIKRLRAEKFLKFHLVAIALVICGIAVVVFGAPIPGSLAIVGSAWLAVAHIFITRKEVSLLRDTWELENENKKLSKWINDRKTSASSFSESLRSAFDDLNAFSQVFTDKLTTATKNLYI